MEKISEELIKEARGVKEIELKSKKELEIVLHYFTNLISPACSFVSMGVLDKKDEIKKILKLGLIVKSVWLAK